MLIDQNGSVHKVCDLPEGARTDRLLELADMIEKFPEHFSMETVFTGNAFRESPTGRMEGIPFDEWVHTCGTSACILGFVKKLYFTPIEQPGLYETLCGEALGLDPDSFDAMCYPSGRSKQCFNYIGVIDARVGATFLRRVVETKRVDWSLIDDVMDAEGRYVAPLST